jgi:c-di-GMP-binding flagellar brake protein YcgR
MVQKWVEKRRYPRFSVSYPVSYLAADKLKIAETLDLSLGGMKIHSLHRLCVDETYAFTIVIEGRAISPMGKVVHTQPRQGFAHGVGVSFSRLTRAHRKRLNTFLSTYGS